MNRCWIGFLAYLYSYVGVTEPFTALSFSVSPEVELIPYSRQSVGQTGWLRFQQYTLAGVGQAVDPALLERHSFVVQQRPPQWLVNVKAGLHWRPRSGLEFRLKGQRLNGRFMLPGWRLCPACRSEIETTLWRDGDVYISLTSHFD